MRSRGVCVLGIAAIVALSCGCSPGQVLGNTLGAGQNNSAQPITVVQRTNVYTDGPPAPSDPVRSGTST